ncbi:MAG: MarR family transcriptional regulator [Rhodobiaceae bacterium]|nr:transcriptional regulator HosA [Rhodobiaceae bacterium]MCR9242011.1 MarR family transcriptional regulator [Rhodobiaceae bacterium]
MAFDKEKSAGFLINHIARLFAKELQHRIQPLGIVTGQFPILLELWEGDGLTQRELLEKLDIEQATLANTLTRMQRDGLIKRTKHPTDARAQLIWLTDKASKIKNEAYQSAAQINMESLSVLSEKDQALFMEFMRRVIAGMRSD